MKEREPDWILTSTEEWVRQDWDEALFGQHGAGLEDAQEGLKRFDTLRNDVADALQCCVALLFFRTAEGHMGLAPAQARAGDIVTVLLGSPSPVLLRPNSDQGGARTFSVVGECFVHGLQDAASLLGPLAPPFEGVAAWVDGDRRCLRFHNTQTGQVTQDDPRLEPLPEWERSVDKLVDGDDTTLYDFFRHKVTGELVNYDPRLEPDMLEARGVRLEWYDLV